MITRRQRVTALVTGTTAITASLGTALIGLAPAADAAALSSCSTSSAAASDASVNAQLARDNAAALAAYKKTAGYKGIHAKNLAAAAALAAAKRQHKPAATIKVLTAKAKAASQADANAIANFKKTHDVTSFSASVTPHAVAGDGTHPGNWNWGVYTTRIYVKNKAVVAGGVCTSINESNAHNDAVPPVTASAEDLTQSADLYQAAVLPTLKSAALHGPAMNKAAILARVHTEIVTTLGAADNLGTNSGASYSVQGFYDSLQAALVKAKL